MELDHANLIQILCFESRITKNLLENFDPEIHDVQYPLFYKMQITANNEEDIETEIRTPFQIALEENQIIGINWMISYIVKYQNKYCFSFLFEESLILMINKGVKVTELLESDVFCHELEFENWPAIHTDPTSTIMPYNGSIFQLQD
jgi:hypothetical protein